QPSAALFPYTTLFRSCGGRVELVLALITASLPNDILIGITARHSAAAWRFSKEQQPAATTKGVKLRRPNQELAKKRQPTQSPPEIGKSTRLNSSHVKT